MVTIIKVKRKITEDPADCLLIEYKKQKKVDDENESIKQILKYAGTANSENDIPDKINELNKNIDKKEDLLNEFKSSKLKDFKENNLNENKKTTKTKRYVLVNKKRGLDEKNDDINVLDVISTDYLNDLNDDHKTNSSKDKTEVREQITCNGVPLIKEKLDDSNYIYDIYYAKNNDAYLDLLLYANNYDIQSYSLYDANFSTLVKNDDEEPDKYYEDDNDDSNDENNWRNDYPDEEDDENYYNEYDNGYDEYDYKLSSMMKKSCIIDNYDDDENDYYNGDEDDGEVDDEYNYEPNRAYNNYKKRILKEYNDDDF